MYQVDENMKLHLLMIEAQLVDCKGERNTSSSRGFYLMGEGARGKKYIVELIFYC